MPILAATEHRGYDSIPAEDEDVTPVDRTITRRNGKSVKYMLIAAFAALLGVVAWMFFWGQHERNLVAVHETSQLSAGGMRDVSLVDMKAAAFNPDKLSFGNVQCQPDNDETYCTNMPPNPAMIRVNPQQKFQSIVGFGGAFTEASAVNFFLLPKDLQNKVLEMYFGNKGNRYTLGRIHINSCDFSLGSYSFDNAPEDFDLQYFDSKVTHDDIFVIPFIQAAMAKSSQKIKLMASPWSPPAWMKKPDDKGEQKMTGSALPNGLRDAPEVKQAWARYISKFISAYYTKGVPIWSVTPQNEPEFPAPWDACAYTKEFEDDFIQHYLGPVLREEHPDLLILGFDHNKDHLVAWTKELMKPREDGSSRYKYIDGMAFHWYSGGDRVEDGTYGYDAINASHHLVPEGLLIASEGCSCPGVELGNWLRAERLGHDIMFDLQNHAQGWIDWNLLLDHKGGPNHLKNFCDAALIANKDFSDITVQPTYHYMGHFSRFIPPGAVRIGSTAVGNYNFEAMDPNIQAGVEVGMYACERSVRQVWRLESPAGLGSGAVASKSGEEVQTGPSRIQLATRALTQDQSYEGTVQLCVAQSARLPDRTAVRLADCTDTRATFLHVSQNRLGQLVDKNTSHCLSFIGDVREPGALLELAPCISSDPSAADHQLFALDVNTGEITAPKVDRKLCLTAGWPFLNAVAFTYGGEQLLQTAQRKTSLVVMNEASVPATFAVYDQGKDQYLGLLISERAIQTVVY